MSNEQKIKSPASAPYSMMALMQVAAAWTQATSQTTRYGLGRIDIQAKDAAAYALNVYRNIVEGMTSSFEFKTDEPKQKERPKQKPESQSIDKEIEKIELNLGIFAKSLKWPMTRKEFKLNVLKARFNITNSMRQQQILEGLMSKKTLKESDKLRNGYHLLEYNDRPF